MYKGRMSQLTTKEVAERLGITVPRVHALIKAGRLPVQRFGRAYMIKESDLKLVKDRKPGRPSKLKEEKARKGSRQKGSNQK
jgi:excisionase family DNA binding protein